MRVYWALGLVILLCSASQVRAESTLRLELRERARAPHFSLGVGHEAFIGQNSGAEKTGDTRMAARLQWSSAGSTPGFAGAIDASGSFSTSDGREAAYQVPEAYVAWRTESAEFSAGRKRESWSRLDSDWTLGLWQPLHRFDALRPDEQGLLGAFVGVRAESFSILAFASPAYLPEQGPGFKLQDGEFKSRNPWFSEPTDRLIVFSRETPVRYSLQTPSAESVVSHPAGGLLARVGGESGLALQAAYSKKPRNHLTLPFDGHYEISGERARVHVIPQVTYHDLVSAETSWRSEQVTAVVSGLAEFPENQAAPQGYTTQVLKPIYLVSPSLEMRLRGERGPQIKLASLHTFGGETQITGPLASSRNPFGARLMYKEAVSVEVQGRLAEFSRSLSLKQKIKWIQEFSERGSILMLDLALTSAGRWSLAAYADALMSQQSEDVTSTFISKYRGNDRAGLRFTSYF